MISSEFPTTMGAGPPRPPQVFRHKRGPSQRESRLVLLTHRLAPDEEERGRSQEGQGDRYERHLRRSGTEDL